MVDRAINSREHTQLSESGTEKPSPGQIKNETLHINEPPLAARLSQPISYRLASEISQRTKLVVTDVDGTLASFWDYFVPALRDFLRDLSVRLEKPVPELAEDIGRVIERRGTHEYPWLLEETGFAWAHYARKPDEFIREFVEPFWAALDANRAKYLRPYSEVLYTLQELRRRGIKVVALSDAPDYMARIRNKQIFDGLLDAIYALETVEPTTGEVWQPITLKHGRKRLLDLQNATSNLKTPLHVLPKNYEKPCPHGLDLVMKDMGVYPYETIFIGDSLAKDGLVAASRGVRYIWAHYGHQLPAEYDELVNRSLKPVLDEPALANAGAARSESVESSADFVHPARAQPAVLVEAIAARYDELLKHL